MEGKKSRIDNTPEDMVIDRISHLPDSILGHILSFLPTQNAVATSILSKRWKSTWFLVHNLDFSFNYPCCYVNERVDRQRTKDKNMKFVDFVERVLLLHDGGSINKFSLYWPGYDISSYHSHVISWINFAITRNVQSLYLYVYASDEMLEIPISGFSCDTLRSLELCEICLVCDAIASVYLPRLENLKLDHVHCAEACEKLISGCPVLQDLDLDIIDDEWVMTSNVFSCESLHSFKLKNGYLSVPAANVVCCTRLEILDLVWVSFESKEACEKLISGCPMLQYLYLYISDTSDGDDDDNDIFTCVISSASLRHLKLRFGKKSRLVLKASSLESFEVDCVCFESNEACEKLISGCPKLQYLDLRNSSTSNGDGDYDIFTCIISSASLRHLKIDFPKKSRLVLKASSLESFEVRGDVYEISVETNLRSVVKADIRIRFIEHDSLSNSNNSIVEAVRAFDCAKVLTLSPSVMRALSHATVSISTEFKRLVTLVVEAFCSSIDVIQNTNNLENLTIDQQQSCRHDHPRWTAPVEVPRCLPNSLKSVQFRGYNGSEGEREMIRYILEHGSALKVMHISCHYYKGDAEKLKLLREISVFPRKSTVCEVHFS